MLSTERNGFPAISKPSGAPASRPQNSGMVVSVGYLCDNPADRITLPRVEKKEIHPLTDEQVKQFLKVASEDEYEIIRKVILFTGL